MKEMNKQEVTDELLNAVSQCEALLSYAQQAYAAFRDGDPELAWQILSKARGFGYFDDEYHMKMIRKYIKENR